MLLCTSIVSFSQNVLSTKDLKDATYRYRHISSQKNCPTCPVPKQGFDLTSDTLKKYVELNTAITKMKPTARIPVMTYSDSDSSSTGEILTNYTYLGKPVYQEAIYGPVLSDVLGVKGGIDKLIDISGWVGYTQVYTNGRQTYHNASFCRKCDFAFYDNMLVVNQKLTDPTYQINRRFYLKFRYTKL